MNLIGKCVVAGNIRRCLPRGTLVHTVEGLVPIESISPGTKVYTSKGVAETVDYVYQGVQELISIHTELGEFECTAGHKMATIDHTGEVIWKRADSLTNERLCFVNNIIKGIETTIQYDTYIISLSDSLAKIIGYLNGFGYSCLSLNKWDVPSF
jgi:ribonucleotide reductase class II